MAANFWFSSEFNHWLLDRDEHVLTMHDLGRNGLTQADLKLMKIFTAELVQALGTKLRVRQQIVATAITYIRRFYAKNSYGACHPLLLTATAMYLAVKVEEWGVQSVRNIIQTLHQHVVRQEFKYVYAQFDQSFPLEAKHVLDCEYYLLEELDCYMIVYHPYRPLLQYVNDNNIKDRDLLQSAWYVVNDSYRTDLCLLYPPYLIAIAALYVASVLKDRDKKPDVKQWFAELTVDMNDVLEIVRILLDMYRVWEVYNHQSIQALLAKIPQPSNSIPIATVPAS